MGQFQVEVVLKVPHFFQLQELLEAEVKLVLYLIALLSLEANRQLHYLFLVLGYNRMMIKRFNLDLLRLSMMVIFYRFQFLWQLGLCVYNLQVLAETKKKPQRASFLVISIKLY